MTRIISFSNHKGGVGKTTSVVNVGAGLAKLRRKVLLIDLDPQANLTQSFGIAEAENSIYGALKGEHEIIALNLYKNLDLVPSTLDLSGAELELSAEAGREYILSELLEPIIDDYHYILIDCPPSLGLLTINALTISTEVFIPLQSHFLAIKGLAKIVEVIGKIKKRINKRIEVSGVFITQFDKRKILHRDVAETILTYFGDKVFKTRIRDNIALAEAPSSGTDIFQYNPKSFGAEDYLKLCREIVKQEKK